MSQDLNNYGNWKWPWIWLIFIPMTQWWGWELAALQIRLLQFRSSPEWNVPSYLAGNQGYSHHILLRIDFTRVIKSRCTYLHALWLVGKLLLLITLINVWDFLIIIFMSFIVDSKLNFLKVTETVLWRHIARISIKVFWF